jgi:hypothetical protein
MAMIRFPSDFPKPKDTDANAVMARVRSHAPGTPTPVSRLLDVAIARGSLAAFVWMVAVAVAWLALSLARVVW